MRWPGNVVVVVALVSFHQVISSPLDENKPLSLEDFMSDKDVSASFSLFLCYNCFTPLLIYMSSALTREYSG